MFSIFGDPAFPLFSKLPIEIQLQIWRYATKPSRYPFVPWCAFFYDISWQLSHSVIQRQIFSLYVRRTLRLKTAAARLNLMSACRCSRQVALEAWRKDFESMEIIMGSEDTDAISHYGADVRERKHEVKYMIMQNVNDLIGQMKDGKYYSNGVPRPCRLVEAIPGTGLEDAETPETLEKTVDHDEPPARKKRKRS